MPEKVQTPTPATALSKEYGLKGRVSLAVDETIVPVAVIANLVPETTKQWQIGYWLGAVVTGYAQTQIYNPPGSGVVASVDWIDAGSVVGVHVIVIAQDAPIGVTATPFYTDRLLADGADAVSPRPRIELHTDNTNVAMPAGNVYAEAQYANGFPGVHFVGPWTLPPGTGIECSINDSVNRQLIVNFSGTVRPLTPEEAAIY